MKTIDFVKMIVEDYIPLGYIYEIRELIVKPNVFCVQFEGESIGMNVYTMMRTVVCDLLNTQYFTIVDEDYRHYAVTLEVTADTLIEQELEEKNLC